MVISLTVITKYIDPNCTSPKKKHSLCLVKYVDVMRQTGTSIDNASDHTLNDLWKEDNEVALFEEWIGTTRHQIYRMKVP